MDLVVSGDSGMNVDVTVCVSRGQQCYLCADIHSTGDINGGKIAGNNAT